MRISSALRGSGVVVESEPFCRHGDIALTDGQYRMSCAIPSDRRGKAVIYNIWQRSDSPEAFYSCIDVEILDGDGSATATPSTTPTEETPVGETPGPVTPTEFVPTNTEQPTTPTPQTPEVGVTPSPAPSSSPSPISSGSGCQVDYEITSDWGSGFNAAMLITNWDSQQIDGWMLTWTFVGEERVNSLWEGVVAQDGANVNVRNASWNRAIAHDGGFTSVGFSASGDSSTIPTQFYLNETACQVTLSGETTLPQFTNTPTPVATLTPISTLVPSPTGGLPVNDTPNDNITVAIDNARWT